MELLSSLSDLELADQIVTWSGRVAAGEARLLALIAEFDAREAWGGPGLLSCAHWLSWRTGLSPGAAREKVRVARALRELPLVAAALGEGRLSFSQARAVTRIATPDDQVRWVELCRSTTAGQLERLVRGVARVRRTEEDAADPELAQWRMRTTTRYDDAGNLTITMKLPAQDGALVIAALEQVQADLDRERSEHRDVSAETPDVGSAPLAAAAAPAPRATAAEALLEMARRTLEQATPDRARRSQARLTVQVDPLSGWARLADGELLPPTSLVPTSLAQVMRSLPGRGSPVRLRPLTPADLTRFDLGRRSRLPSQHLRDLLGTVDGERCRFPGCTRHRRLHAHHVTWWSEGGVTDLENLVLVCSRHHTLVHSQGFRLVLDVDRRLQVSTADGVSVLHHPAPAWDDAERLDDVSAETLPPDRAEARMDLGYCVAVLVQQAA